MNAWTLELYMCHKTSKKKTKSDLVAKSKGKLKLLRALGKWGEEAAKRFLGVVQEQQLTGPEDWRWSMMVFKK